MEKYRTPFIVSVRAQWILARVHSYSVCLPVCSRGSILKVICPVVLGHPGPFDPALLAVLIPVTVTLPDMCCLEAEKVLGRAEKLS
jgi:hypothetical protein